ncbi:hypothetical protein MRX96_057954 [Rhipicephalus microplus]
MSRLPGAACAAGRLPGVLVPTQGALPGVGRRRQRRLCQAPPALPGSPSLQPALDAATLATMLSVALRAGCHARLGTALRSTGGAVRLPQCDDQSTYAPIRPSPRRRQRVVEGDAWDPKLLNSTSEEFRIKSAKYANMLEAAYRKSPQLHSCLSKVTIYAFRQGSLIVVFELEVDKHHTPSVVDLESEFRETLRREAEKGPHGAFGHLKIDQNTIEMTEMPESSLPHPGNAVDRESTISGSSTVKEHNREGDQEHRDSEQWINQHSQDPSDYFVQDDNETSPHGIGGADDSWQPFFPERPAEGDRAEGEDGEVTWENAPELSEDDDSHDEGRQEYSSKEDHQGGHAIAAVKEHGSVVITTRPQVVVTEPPYMTEEGYPHVIDASTPTVPTRVIATSQDRFMNKHGSELTELTVGAGVVIKVNRNPVSTKDASKASAH